MLTPQQIELNKKRFQDANVKYDIFTKHLESFLGDDFYIAPATSSTDMYGCYPGGLLNHCLRACKYAVKINETFPKKMKIDNGSIFKCIFLSQIGKVFLYQPNKNEWQIKNGRIYAFNDNLTSLKVSERSSYYAMKYGVNLNDEEYQAILNSDSDEKNGKYHLSILTHIIKLSLELSILEEKNG